MECCAVVQAGHELGRCLMIADRRYLAAQVRELQLELSLLSEWTESPDRPFPGDAVALAGQFRRLAELLTTIDIPGAQAE